MVAKDFWKAYAGDTTVVSGKSAYKFSHDQEIFDSSTQVEYSSSFSTYLFHYNKQTKVQDSQGNIPHVVYSGGVLILALDDGRKDYDGQLAGDDTQGMYEGTIRALIDEATILREIRDFANKSITYKCVDLKITSSQDVTRMKLGKFLGTGIWIEYTMLIRHDTYLVGTAPPVADVSFELILETSDFSTSNGWTHSGVETFTANADGIADLVDVGVSGLISYDVDIVATSYYLLTFDTKDAGSSSGRLNIDIDTDLLTGSLEPFSRGTRPLLDSLSDYLRFHFAFYSYSDSGTITVSLLRNAGSVAFYIKNFRVYKLTFGD